MLAGESSIENALGQKMAHARDHLAQVFHRYINGEPGLRKIAISINRNPLDAIDPFLTEVTSTQRLDEDRFFVESKQVTVKPFILPHITKLTAEQMHRAGGREGLRSHQGFYVYRNRRLIIWGTWFRLARKDELSKLARVRVDIPNSLDHLWTLDIKKSVAHPPEAVRTNLRRTLERIAERSRRTYTFRGRVSVRDDLTHGWSRMQSRDGLRYDINRAHPAIQAVEQKLDEQGKILFKAMLEIVERSFPTDSLYADMASDHKVTHEKEGPEGSLLEVARQLVSCLLAGSAAQRSLVASLNTLEPFCHDPDIVKTITEELKDVS